MIVEDDVKIRTLIGVFLKKWNFESMIVETFDQVDKLVLLEKPNILLMDIIMAMNVGEDDFIQKPFFLDVLVAKIQAVLRCSNRSIKNVQFFFLHR